MGVEIAAAAAAGDTSLLGLLPRTDVLGGPPGGLGNRHAGSFLELLKRTHPLAPVPSEHSARALLSPK